MRDLIKKERKQKKEKERVREEELKGRRYT
jgi:hypothetical protein